MKQSYQNKLSVLALSFVLLAISMPRLLADENTAKLNDVVDMVSGDIQTIPVNKLNRVSVTNPEVADVSDAQSDKVSIIGKSAGETELFLWDDAGKRTIKIRVVKEDLNNVRARVQKVLDAAGITGVTLEENPEVGKLIVSGAISKENKSRMETILDPYSDNILNLVKVEKSEDLIQVDMQVVEISTTLTKNLGILWGDSVTASTSGSTASGSNSNQNNGNIQLNYNETLPSMNGKISDFFKIGNFYRTTPIEATVNALIQEGKARLISKPRLVVVSGKQASFLVGGEIPINNTTSNATGTQLTTSTSYTQYGVNMTVTPTLRDGKIDVLLNVDIRDIDGSTPITSNNGGNIAFITRTAQTDLLMDNKQTIALAGLIKYSDSAQVTKVPFLGNIPVLGALFRNRTEPSDSNTEMVIILTPTVLSDKKFADSQTVMPTPSERDAYNEIDGKYEHEALPTWPAPKVDVVSDTNVSPAAPSMPSNVMPPPSDFKAPPVEEDMAVSQQPAAQPPAVDTALMDEMTRYARMVQVKISKAITYPKAVMGQSMSGTVKLKLHILKDGSLDSEEVMESSGNGDLDQDALQAAKTAAPYEAFTSGMDQADLIFTIPIVYNKLITEAQVPAGKPLASN